MNKEANEHILSHLQDAATVFMPIASVAFGVTRIKNSGLE